MTLFRRISLRARLAALTLIPLIGLAFAAHLWATDRQEHARLAESREEATHLVVELAELQLAVKMDEKVASGLGGKAPQGPAALVANQALDAIHIHRKGLAAKEAELDALAGRKGAWREVAQAVDTLLRLRDAQSPSATREKASFEVLASSLGRDGQTQIVRAFTRAIGNEDASPTPESVAAASAIHKFMHQIGSASPDHRATVVLLSRVASLEETIVDQAFLSLRLLAGRPVDATTAPALSALEARQRNYVEVSRMLIPSTEAPLLEDLTTSQVVREWYTLTTFLQQYAQAKPADRPALPPVEEGGALAFEVTTALIRYRADLAAALAADAAAHAAEARDEANAAIAGLAGVILLTLVLGISIAVSIRRPLKRLEHRAHRLSLGELETDEKRKTAPKEIEIVLNAFDELASTLSVIGAQATAFSTGDVANPILQQDVPGELGKAMRDSSRRLAAIGADLRASEELSRAIVTNAADAIWTIDSSGTIVTANPAAAKLLGCSDHWIGRPASELLGREIANDDGMHDVSNEEIWLRKPDGSRIPALVSTSKAADIWTVFARDISELKEYEARLSHQAFHDELTGLPNRALLLDRVEHALARAGRDEWAVALLMIDLDDFKQVNDALGHTAGDELLTNAAERIQSCLRPGDTAARLGGDEFAVLLEDNVNTDTAAAVATRIAEVLQLPLTAGDRDLAATASVGLTVATIDSTPHTLLRDADTAMYAAKTAGKGQVQAFTPSMHEDATRRLSLKNDLSVALENDELRLLFQPLIELSSREIVGAEALLRWHHPSLGIVSPLDFIPVAEESGLIVPIGRWVLRESCIAAASWPETGRRTAVNVNVSGVQLANDNLVEAVREALDISGLEPNRLVLELTESVLLDDVDNVATVLTGLKELGVSIAIDDFGTGYCSLAYLKKFPVDHLKIDRAFIEDLTQVNGDRSLARSIVDLAGVLGLSAVAEGVETAEQADLLQALACDFAQGYHFSRPIELDKLTELIGMGTSELVAG